MRKPPYFDGMPAEPEPVTDIAGARVLALLGDSVTTDHISPAGSIKPGTPAAQYLDEHGVDKKDYNSYGSRRGNHEVMIRGTFANIRLRNQLLDDVSGGYTRDFTNGGEQAFIYDAAQNYAAQNIPLVVLGGKEYGSGSSRDWAAKGTSLLGVRAVITESFERIHRSNLIGMGVIPLQFPEGESAASLKLDGTETFDITGIEALNDGKTPKTVHVTATKEDGEGGRVRRGGAHRHPRRGGLLPQRRHPAVRAAQHVEDVERCARSIMPRVTDDHLAARRRQILDGARRCFAEYGYDKATVRRLEQTIGLSRGAIFHHFRDKDTLFFELAREDAERMADVASREGLIQVMRDMLAAPDQFDWLATRLEIARKLRNDPAFNRGWSERSAELSAATTARLRRQKQAGRLRDDVPSAVLQTYLDLVLDGLVARLASGDDPEKLSAVLDLVEASLRQQ